MSYLELLPTDLKIQVQDVIQSYAPSEEVFKALIQHFDTDSNKRRKTDGGNGGTSSGDGKFPTTLQGCHIILQIPDLSVQSPLRKKLNLVFGCLPGERTAFLALTKSIDSEPELIIKDLTTENITFATLLRVPEKKAIRTILIMYKNNWDNKFKNDPLLIQFNYDILTEQFGPLLGNSDLATYLQHQCSIVGFPLIDSTAKDHKSFFVESYKGSKEGYLYFLPNHVIFGFKKPILLFKSSDIESITYSSITRLTFNVTLHVKELDVESNRESLVRHEFSMIDQKEYERINDYVTNKAFRDKSMTEELKAKTQLKNPEAPGALVEAARMVPGGEQIVNEGDSDDEEEDGNFQMGNESDLSDGSGESGDDDDEEEEEDDEEDSEEDDEEGEDGDQEIDLEEEE